MVVLSLLLASTASFIEHACHVDVLRFLASMCCCDGDTREEMDHHVVMVHTGMDHTGLEKSGGHGDPVMDHGDEHKHSHHTGDHEACHDDSPTSATCCSDLAQAGEAPALVRFIHHESEGVSVLIARVWVMVKKPPPVFTREMPDISPPHLALLPGYLLFGAFLN